MQTSRVTSTANTPPISSAPTRRTVRRKCDANKHANSQSRRAAMSIIKARTNQKHLVRHITRLYRENNETLFAYAKFIGEHTEYVLNQLVETVLAKDKDFQVWREQNADSFVPKPGERKR